MESDRDIDVSDDYLILDAVGSEHDITAKHLASMTGRSLAQVYRYLSGEATIPSLIWRTLYEKTRDIRIPQLVTGDVPVTVVDLVEDETAFERLDAPGLKQIIRQRKEQIVCEDNLLDILADGKITKKDAAAVAAYKRNHPKMIATSIKLFRAVTDAYERSRQ